MTNRPSNWIPYLLSLTVAFSCSLFAQKRYFRDQGRQKVVVEGTQTLGELRDGKLYLQERQAVEMALRQNLELNVQRHRPLAGFWEVESRRGIYDPLFGFGFNWDRNKTPAASILAGGDNITDINTDYNFSYGQDFPKGGRLEFFFSGNRNRTNNSFASLVPAISTDFSLTFRQNLLQGFGRVDADYDIEISRNDLQISEFEFERRLIETIGSVQEGYWDLQFALRDIEVQEKSLQLANTVLEQNQARFEVGSAARLEVIEAEAEVASRRELLIRARFDYRLAQDQLIRIITAHQDPRRFPAEIVPADGIYRPDEISSPFQDLYSQALQSRPELAQADLRIENQRLGLQRSRNRLKPSLDLVLGYRQFGLGGTQIIRDFSQGFVDPPVIGIVPGGLGDSLEQLFGADFYGYVVGLDLRLPLSNQTARSENARAQILLDEETLRRRSVEQQVAVEIREALTSLEKNRAQVQASEALVRLEQERLDGQQARFDVGMSTTRQLIEAQRELVLAQSILLRNEVELIKSRIRLDQALGATLQAFRIRLADAVKVNVR